MSDCAEEEGGEEDPRQEREDEGTLVVVCERMKNIGAAATTWFGSPQHSQEKRNVLAERKNPLPHTPCRPG